MLFENGEPSLEAEFVGIRQALVYLSLVYP